MKKVASVLIGLGMMVGTVVAATPANALDMDIYDTVPADRWINDTSVDNVYCSELNDWVWTLADLHSLDRDGNGIGCEPWNDGKPIKWTAKDQSRLLQYLIQDDMIDGLQDGVCNPPAGASVDFKNLHGQLAKPMVQVSKEVFSERTDKIKYGKMTVKDVRTAVERACNNLD